MFVEVSQLIVCVLFFIGEARWLGRAGESGFVDLGWHCGGHVRVNADQLRRCEQRHLLGDGISPVATLSHVSFVSEAVHQHDPRTCDADGIPAGRGRFPGESVAG